MKILDILSNKLLGKRIIIKHRKYNGPNKFTMVITETILTNIDRLGWTIIAHDNQNRTYDLSDPRTEVDFID